MNFNITAILSLSLIIPVIIGLLRISKTHKAYYPFIIAITLGFINELLSIILILNGYYNTINSNIFILLEACLLVWQFHNWNLFQGNKKILYSFCIGLFCAWILETMIIYSFTRYASYFFILYASLMTVLSIFLLNKLISRVRGSLFKHPAFIICIAFLLFYPACVLSEAFWVYGYNQKDFANSVRYLVICTNSIAIILYTFAILWMPTRQNFTLPSS